jgi:hypothetical protein
MKIINKTDLELLLRYSDDESFDLEDFKCLLDKWGDDYFFENGEFICTNRNENMATIRDYSLRIHTIKE